MLQNQQTFRMAKGKIQGLKNDCDIEANKNSEDAKKLSKAILTLNDRAKALKASMDEMLKKDGIAAKNTDDYVNANSEFVKTVAESQRVSFQLDQAKSFIEKYGLRSATMQKFGQKLTMVETSMDIKVLDFDATIEILKKDYDFAEKSRQATDTAKSAMLFTKPWELDYAIEKVTSTITADIAITSGNLKDIDSLTKNFSIDSDEQFNTLDALASSIRGGGETIPDVKAYQNPDYKFTASDKQKSGGFDNIF